MIGAKVGLTAPRASNLDTGQWPVNSTSLKLDILEGACNTRTMCEATGTELSNYGTFAIFG